MAGETPAPVDASVAIVAAKAPTKRELRKLGFCTIYCVGSITLIIPLIVSG